MRSSDILREGEPLTPYKSIFDVVLIEPDIPQNTGNIGRTCVGTKSDLHLVGEMGFQITDKNLKRAGLDYWQNLRWKHWDSIPQWESQLAAPQRVFYFSAFAEKSYFDVQYQAGDTFVFGKETKGLPEDLMRRNWSNTLLIPIFGPVRGFNVATAVAIVLYEALRQVQPKP
jgi:tRNA (cytidine/uridine-2'-O-)-methyltransferase